MRQYKSVLGCSKSCEKGETSEPCSLLRTSAECRISQARWCLTAGGACPWAPPSSPPSVFTLCCCFLNMKHSQAWAGGRSWAPSDLQGRIFVNHTHLIDGDSCPGAGRGPCIGGRERASGDRTGAHFCTGVTTLPPVQLSPYLPITLHPNFSPRCSPLALANLGTLTGFHSTCSSPCWTPGFPLSCHRGPGQT